MSRILVVEDDPTVGMVLESILELEDHEVEVARDVPAAKTALAEGAYDLILLDLLLPSGQGVDVINHLRVDLGRQTPIIVLSGLKHEGNTVRALEAGANDYMTKPFSPRELIARVARWTSSRENVARAR